MELCACVNVCAVFAKYREALILLSYRIRYEYRLHDLHGEMYIHVSFTDEFARPLTFPRRSYQMTMTSEHEGVAQVG